MLNIEQLGLVQQKKYTEFSDVIKGELQAKLARHQTIQNFSKETDRIQNLKTAFQNINSMNTDKE